MSKEQIVKDLRENLKKSENLINSLLENNIQVSIKAYPKTNSSCYLGGNTNLNLYSRIPIKLELEATLNVKL
jgi:hypothetical protein